MATVDDKKEFDILMVTSTAHKVASKNIMSAMLISSRHFCQIKTKLTKANLLFWCSSYVFMPISMCLQPSD